MKSQGYPNGRVTAQPVADVDELTPSWLSSALGREVICVAASPVGTGQMGVCYRLELTGDPELPATILAKLPAIDEATRTFLHGSYQTEVTFYRDLLSSVNVKAPHPYYAAISAEPESRGVFTLLLQDLAPAVQGDQIAGCTPLQARRAVENIAGLHAPRWCDPTLLDVPGMALAAPADAETMDALFPDAVETTLSMLADLVSDENAATLRKVAAFGGRWTLGRPDRFGLVHGDYRLDNILFHDDGALWAVDWQTLALGLPARDVAFVVSSGLSIEQRRAHERDIVRAYWTRLVGQGVREYSEGECWDDYRLGLLQAPLIAVFGCAYSSVRTERGDHMFAAIIERGCQAMRDLGTLDLLRHL